MDISAITYSLFIPLLNSIHEFIQGFGLNSFGWSIVVLTAGVKLIMTPLTFKQIKSTKSMQLAQPKLKKMQDEFKKKEAQLASNPEKLKDVRMKFQQEMMGFYQQNNINPLGGCLPLLIQMPILLGLFWTFSGSPFQEKPIYVDVKVVTQEQASKRQIKPSNGGEIFVDEDGNRSRIAASTKGITILEGEEFIVETIQVTGDAQLNKEKINWNFFGNKESSDIITLENIESAKVKVIAKQAGTEKIQALLPATLHGDSFLFIDDFSDTGLFNKKTGGINLDILILVALFGASIWLSSKLNAPKLAAIKPGEVEDPQIAMQRSMTTMMPIMMTVMMLFIPLPAGALLYMVISSIIQSAQTYFAMQRYDKKFAAQ